jgi:hypothetical protein
MRFKLWIATIIDKIHPGVCWADLVLWAMDIHGWSEIDWSGKCKKPPYFDHNWGGCYCGKFNVLNTRAVKRAGATFPLPM